MPLESRQSRFASDQVINKAIFPEKTIQLGVNDQVVRASTVSGGGGAFTITLPSVVEARGRFYSIFMVARNSAENITLTHMLHDDATTNGGYGGLSNITFAAAGGHILLYSDGYVWHRVAMHGT